MRSRVLRLPYSTAPLRGRPVFHTTYVDVAPVCCRYGLPTMPSPGLGTTAVPGASEARMTSSGSNAQRRAGFAPRGRSASSTAAKTRSSIPWTVVSKCRLASTGVPVRWAPATTCSWRARIPLEALPYAGSRWCDAVSAITSRSASRGCSRRSWAGRIQARSLPGRPCSSSRTRSRACRASRPRTPR